MRVRFARTLRKYVRTEKWNLKEPLWTEETSQAAEEKEQYGEPKDSSRRRVGSGYTGKTVENIGYLQKSYLEFSCES